MNFFAVIIGPLVEKAAFHVYHGCLGRDQRNEVSQKLVRHHRASFYWLGVQSTPEPVDRKDITKGIQGVPLKSPPFNLLSTRSHVNWLQIDLSARGYKGILYLENLGWATLAEHPVKKSPNQTGGMAQCSFFWPSMALCCSL